MKIPHFLDCTLRDGGYINQWRFTRDFAKALYRAVSEAGCDYLEIGFFNPASNSEYPWANISPRDMAELREDVDNPAKLAVMINYGEVNLEDVPEQSSYPADLLRIAAPLTQAQPATQFAAKLSEKGFRTTVNYMAVSNYSNQDILHLLDHINAHQDQIEFFYIADSFGSLIPRRTHEIITTLRFGTDARLGFHPHNNLQMAFANCLEAIDAGIDIIDGSIFGMGRGAGNLYTDAIIAYFESIDPDRFHVLPILQFSDIYMDALKAKYDWGYSLPQLLSGVLKCHPNYPTNLLKAKAYTADDIYYMLQNLNEQERLRYSATAAQRIERTHLNNMAASAPVHIHAGLIELRERAGGAALLVGGGQSVVKEQEAIRDCIAREQPTVFGINSISAPFELDGVFFGNRRRLLQYVAQVQPEHHLILGAELHRNAGQHCPTTNISTINSLKLLPGEQSPFESRIPSNSAIEAILGLVQCGYKRVLICGLDGYAPDNKYYYQERDQLDSQSEMDAQNRIIAHELEVIKQLSKILGFEYSIITQTIFAEHHALVKP